MLALVLVFVLSALVTAQFTIVQKNNRQSAFFGGYESLRQYADSGARLALHDLRFNVTGNDGKVGTTAWTTSDDVGADGVAGTLDTGEGDGRPTPGEPNLVPVPIGPHAAGVDLIVHVEDAPYTNTKRIVSTAFSNASEATVESYVQTGIAAAPRASAVYLDPSATLDLAGTEFSITGNDTNLDGTAGPEAAKYGITTEPGTPAGTNAATFTTQVPVAHTAQITGLGGTPSIGEVGSAVDTQSIFNNLKHRAHNVIGPGTHDAVSWGDPTSWEITYVTGDLELTGVGSGTGILLVDGNVTLSGEFDFQGLVIVRGDVVQDSTTAETRVHGSVWLTGYLTLTETGGDADFFYSSTALDGVDAMLAGSSVSYIVLYWNQLK